MNKQAAGGNSFGLVVGEVLRQQPDKFLIGEIRPASVIELYDFPDAD